MNEIQKARDVLTKYAIDMMLAMGIEAGKGSSLETHSKRIAAAILDADERMQQ